jgi:peptide/nickel transport system substrate-binding protein
MYADETIDRSGGSPSGERRIDRRELLRGVAGAGLGLAGSALLEGRPSVAWADTPKRGGNLRVAMLGGSTSDTVDAHTMVNQVDSARVMTLYEGLVQLDTNAQVVNVLAESMEPNADATEWTVRLRKGIKFHDGRTVKPEDVAFTFRRIADPKTPLAGAAALAAVDLDNLKVVDDRTLKIPMKAPYAAFPECISASYFFGIVPSDYDPKKPIGTGPFKFDSFTPGQQSVFSAFRDYWQQNGPFLDAVTIIDFSQDTAALNALQGGEIDIFAYAPLSLVNQAKASGQIKALVSKPGQWTPFTMRVDQAPFDNPDVRMAMRLLVDRQQLVNIALSGLGKVGNDVFGQWDPSYDKSLVRERDLDQAKFLLKKAGREGLTVELVTSDIAAGVVQAAQVFARQAKDAGVTVKVRQVTLDVFYGDQYLKWPFAQDYWSYNPYMCQVLESYTPTAWFNETHWDDKAYAALYAKAQATLDPAKRFEVIHEMQQIDFTQGGYIIAAYNQSVDLMGQNVQGLVPTATGLALGNFGFGSAWLS